MVQVQVGEIEEKIDFHFRRFSRRTSNTLIFDFVIDKNGKDVTAYVTDVTGRY